MNKIIAGLITFHNMENKVYKALSAIENQTIKLDCLIIVDDASVDSTPEQIEAFKMKSKIPTYFLRNEVNQGVSKSRNAAIDIALEIAPNFSYMVIYDGDDESQPDRNQIQIEALTKFDDEICASVCLSETQYNKRYTLRPIKQNRIYVLRSAKDLFIFLACGYKIGQIRGIENVTIQTSNLVVNRKAIDKHIRFSEEFKRNEDADLIMQILDSNGFFILQNENLVLRFSTTASYKNAISNFEYESKLLEKWGPKYLTNRQISFARLWNKVELNWHSRKILRLIYYTAKTLAIHPNSFARRFYKYGFSRFAHELQISIYK